MKTCVINSQMKAGEIDAALINCLLSVITRSEFAASNPSAFPCLLRQLLYHSSALVHVRPPKQEPFVVLREAMRRTRAANTAEKAVRRCVACSSLVSSWRSNAACGTQKPSMRRGT